MGEEPPVASSSGIIPPSPGVIHVLKDRERGTLHAPLHIAPFQLPSNMILRWILVSVLVVISSSRLGTTLVPRQDPNQPCTYDTCPDLSPDISDPPTVSDGLLSCMYIDAGNTESSAYFCVYNATSVSIVRTFTLCFSSPSEFRVTSKFRILPVVRRRRLPFRAVRRGSARQDLGSQLEL